MIVNNVGKVYDLISVYQKHFGFISNDFDNSKDSEWLDKGEISDEFCIFFYPYKKNVLMENLLLEDVEKLIRCDSIQLVLKSIFDYRKLISQVIKFYFADDSFKFECEDYESLRYAGRLIANSDLPDKIKSCMSMFFLEPTYISQKLIGSMLHIGMQISNLYENKFESISNLAINFDESELQEYIDSFDEDDSKEGVQRYYSFGLLKEKEIKVWNLYNCKLVYLGLDYKNSLVKPESFRLEAVGKVLSDPSRIKILDCMLEKGEITVSDINKIFGFSGTTSYYHINMMQKANMLKVNAKNRTLYYSINSECFASALKHISKYNQTESELKQP